MNPNALLLIKPEPILRQLGRTKKVLISEVGYINVGQTVLGPEGPRFVLGKWKGKVVFSLQGRYYTESESEFKANTDTKYAPLANAARNSLPVMHFFEKEIALIMGLFSSAEGTVGFIFGTGKDITEFLVENRQKLAGWMHQLKAFWQVKSYLITFAPAIYKLFSAVARQFLKNSKIRIPDSPSSEEIGSIVGSIIGSCGKEIAEKKFSLLTLFKETLKELAKLAGKDLLGKAVKTTSENIDKTIMNKLHNEGILLSEEDIHEILTEIKQHPEEIKRVLQILNN